MRPSTIPIFSAGVITGALVAAGVAFAAPSKADVDRQVVAYVAVFGGAVCDTLDSYPTFDGFTARQAGQVIGLSVAEICPRHSWLIAAFVDRFAGGQVA